MSSEQQRLAILSDIHYAGKAEQARGNDYELRVINNPLLRLLVRLHRRFIWMREPLQRGYLLDQFLENLTEVDWVIANGDYSCNTGFVGVSDSAAFESTRECLGKLRETFGAKLKAVLGDHELGKMSLIGQAGGMRLASWHRAVEELGLEPFWRLELGKYVLMGITSSLVALPVYEHDALAGELEEWRRLRAAHLRVIRSAFDGVTREQKILLFCHDPTALPFLAKETAVQARLSQLEQTVIGHLHSPLVLWKGQLLAGMPRITFLGHTARRLSGALQQARAWKPFNVRLCPALGGIQLLNDGGYYTANVDPMAERRAQFEFRQMPRDW